MYKALALVISLTSLTVACSSDRERSPGTTPSVDSGVPDTGGSALDAGLVTDSGVAPDAGAAPDAGPTGPDPYRRCQGTCPAGPLCLFAPDPTPGNPAACAPDCTGQTPCPDPRGGTAMPACSPAASGVEICALDCSAGETCPDGMVCRATMFPAFEQVCVWQ